MYRFLILLLLISIPALGVEDADFDESNGLDIMQKYSISFAEPIESSSFKLKLLREN